MPSYTYKAEDGEVKEVVQSIFADLPAEFVIGGRTYRRIFEPVSVIYKSMGFYSTDNLDGIETWRKQNLGKGD